MDNTSTDTIERELAELTQRVAPERGSALVNAMGTACSVAGLAGWVTWLAWRVAHLHVSLISIAVLALEIVAFSAALIVTAGFFAARPLWRENRRGTDASRQLPMLLAEGLELGHIVHEIDATSPGGMVVTKLGPDDTGEIAWARRGIRVLGDQRRLDHRSKLDTANLREAAWSIIALDGLRRLLSVVALVVMLFTGFAPFDVPPTNRMVMLGGGIALLSVGHWLMSGGHVRPGSRLIWSMASIGAGLGDGVSRSGLPIRWAMTMATLVVLNISVALRGMSDRWTHGLGVMDDTSRVGAMSVALGLVAVGGLAMRTMPRPELGFYGATRRLEETSVRRLALGMTLLVAIIGFVAGLAPADTLLATR